MSTQAQTQGGAVKTQTQLSDLGLPQDNRLFGIWVFLAGECAFFASLIGTYLAVHMNTHGGPTPQQIIDIPLATVATLTLLTSSLTVVLGISAMQRGDLTKMKMWIWVTALLGLFFLEAQGYEFATFYSHGLMLTTSPFGSAFFTLTGFHGMHVAFGVFWLLLMLSRVQRYGLTKDRASKVFTASIYWHFVDVVWVVIFTVVYLVGKVG